MLTACRKAATTSSATVWKWLTSQFADGRHGRYWFTRGWNVPAVLAWIAGSTFGVLSVNTDLVAGPLADIAGGVDVSALGSGAVAALVYLTAVAVVPARVDPQRPPRRVPALVPA